MFRSVIFVAFLLNLAEPAIALRLSLWEHEKDTDQKVLDEITARFEKKNRGIDVKRSHYKTEDLRTQFQTAAMGGGGADIVLAPNDFAGPFAIMRIVQPVESFARLERFNEQTVAAVTDAEGRTWGFPTSNGNHLVLLVNKKFIEKTPKTMDELVKAAKAVHNPEKNVFGFAYNLNEPYWFISFLAGFGEKPLVGGEPRLNTSGMIQALQFVHDLKFVEKITPSDCDYSCADTLFADGKAAMIINGDWSVGRYKKALGEQLVVAPLPLISQTKKHMAPMVSGKYLFFNRRLKGRKLAAAKKFAEFIVSPEIQEYWLSRSQRLPALKKTSESPAVKNDPLTSQTLDAMRYGEPMPMDVEMRAIWDAIRPPLQGVMSGRTTPGDAASAMQKRAELKIKEMREE